MPEATVKPLAYPARAEHELLLCCARTHMDAEGARRLRAVVQEGIDWKFLVGTALPHGMIPLLTWHLQAICPDAVPQAVLAHLRKHFHRNVRNNLLLTGELLQLLELLEAHGIPAIPYKGPVLAASLYDNLALRQFRDLDLLVAVEDVPRTRDLLVSQGYRGDLPLNGVQEAAFLRSQCELPFVREDGRVIVELHWAITPRYFSFPLDPDRLWDRVESVRLGGKTVPSLSPEDLCLMLCAHGCLHLWERLEWICDVAQLLQVHKMINWGRLISYAATLGSERMLSLGLLLASDLLEAPLPNEILERVWADTAVTSLALQVCQRLFRWPDRPPAIAESSLFHNGTRERRQDKLRYWFRLAMTQTPRDWELVPLPESLSHLYYLLRPIRLIGKYGGSALRSFRGGGAFAGFDPRES